ncbi:HrpE/YscL family type III secretion apparatus protein [Desulfovibrio inopinatus]|uniref:HrpE/YscL family type III secretion apparatus protein n=1 Tax=Desulfovibrio inopinatus TaxID=102109 RepID=UPI000400F9AF|nr:HrpE/YscL family type III secretion apparatus protein [Desulfovibrio inopinatus]
MGELFLLKDMPIFTAGQKVIKAKEFAEVTNSSKMLRQAHEEAQRLRDSVQAEFDRQKAEGFKQGQEEAKAQAAELMIQYTADAIKYLHSLEDITVDLVMAALNKILGQMDDRGVVLKIVKQSLYYIQGQKKARLHVRPEVAQTIRETITSSEYPGFEVIEVIPDERLKKGDCLLATEVGHVDCSVDTQLKAIRKAFANRLQEEKKSA